jgi:hypothetical protein
MAENPNLPVLNKTMTSTPLEPSLPVLDKSMPSTPLEQTPTVGAKKAPKSSWQQAQEGFDKYTKPEAYGTDHGQGNFKNGMITTASDLGAGVLSLATPVFHSLQTLKSALGLAGIATGNPFNETAENLVKPYVPEQNEKGKHYAGRVAGQVVSTLPLIAAGFAVPEEVSSGLKTVGNTIADTSKATLPYVGEVMSKGGSSLSKAGEAVSNFGKEPVKNWASTQKRLTYEETMAKALRKNSERAAEQRELTPGNPEIHIVKKK